MNRLWVLGLLSLVSFGALTVAPRTAVAGEEVKLKKQKDGSKNPWELEIGGRIYTLFWYRDEMGKPKNELIAEKARLQLEWRHDAGFDAELSIDLGGIHDDSPHTLLRDAYVDYKFHRAAHLRLGQFKRPFSWLEMTSRKDLPVVQRGLGNEFLVRDMAYGSRDLGIEFNGRVGRDFEVEYALGVFNGGGLETEEVDLNGAKDIAARIRISPADWIRVGGSFSYKMFDTGVQTGVPDSAWAAAGELRLKFGDFRLQTEFIWAENWLQLDPGNAWDILVLARYTWDIPGTKEMKLQPLFRMGLLVPNNEQLEEGKVWTFTPGLNWIVTDFFRLMVQGHIIRSGQAYSAAFPDSTGVMVQGAIDL